MCQLPIYRPIVHPGPGPARTPSCKAITPNEGIHHAQVQTSGCRGGGNGPAAGPAARDHRGLGWHPFVRLAHGRHHHGHHWPRHCPLHPLGGTIDHRGGILFADYKTGKHVEVSNFVIDLSHGDLTGIVNGNPKTRTALFTLSLAHAKLAAGRLSLKATGITVDLTAGAAAALNSALGTTLFSGGPDLGTAATSVCF
jgi:hypothetical protein